MSMDWLPLLSVQAIMHRAESIAGSSARCLDRMVIGEKHTPLKALGCRGLSVILVLEGLASDCWDVKRHADLLGQLLHISHFHYGSQLLPPVGCVQLAGLPFQPQIIVLYQWLWQVTLSTLVPQPVMGISKKCSNSGLRVGRGPKLLSSSCPQVNCSWGSVWGLSSEGVPSSGLQNVMCLSGLCQFRD